MPVLNMGSFKLRSCGAEMSHCGISCVLSRAPHTLPAWQLLLCARSPKAADGTQTQAPSPNAFWKLLPGAFSAGEAQNPQPRCPQASRGSFAPTCSHPALVASSHLGVQTVHPKGIKAAWGRRR